LIEGGLIDHACHEADLDKAIAEVLEFNAAVETVLAWLDGRDDTLLIVTADHETGGLTLRGDRYQKGDTVRARFTTQTIPGLPALHSKQRVPLFASGPGAEAVPAHLDNTGVYCLMRNALAPAEPKGGGHEF
jgi:alkaline phosphatase